jgi:hypothetical protein
MKIALIGTCRMHDPLQNLWSDESYIVLNDKRPSFTHNSSEIIQRIEHYGGDYVYPEELQDYQIQTSSTTLKEGIEISDVDFFIVEISSLKLIQFNKHHLQWNYITSQVREKLGGEIGEKWLTMMHDAFKGEGGEVAKTDIFDYPGHISEEVIKILSSVEVRTQSLEDLEDDMKKIHGLTRGKVIFVTHINATGKGGSEIKARSGLIRSIVEICNNNGFRCIDPSEMLSSIGQKKLMNEMGEDTEHYNKEVIDEIGQFLLGRVFEAYNE